MRLETEGNNEGNATEEGYIHCTGLVITSGEK